MFQTRCFTFHSRLFIQYKVRHYSTLSVLVFVSLPICSSVCVDLSGYDIGARGRKPTIMMTGRRRATGQDCRRIAVEPSWIILSPSCTASTLRTAAWSKSRVKEQVLLTCRPSICIAGPHQNNTNFLSCCCCCSPSNDAKFSQDRLPQRENIIYWLFLFHNEPFACSA